MPQAKLLYTLPIYDRPDVDTKTGGRAKPGIYTLHEQIVTDGIAWFEIDPGWIVAESGGTWAVEIATDAVIEAVPLPLDPDDWKGALRVQQACVDWVSAAQQRVLNGIPDDASSVQRACVAFMSDVVGMQEDQGANMGAALTPGFVAPYRDYWGIAGSGGLAWCALLAWAADLHAKGGDWTLKADWKRICPLGNWWGSAYDTYRVAKERDLWVPTSALPEGTAITGAKLVKNTRGDSDAGGSRAGGRWPGHVDIAVCWESDGRLLVVGGNKGNTCKPGTERASAYIGAVL